MTTLEQELNQMKSYDAIQCVLHGISLKPLQCIDVLKMLARKRGILSYDTGSGKTFMMAAVMKLLWNENPSRKFIVFVKYRQLLQTPKKLQSVLGKDVLSSAADVASIKNLLRAGIDSTSILMLTHDCLHSSVLMQELYKRRDRFCGVFIDEAHSLCNASEAKSASLLASMLLNFEYCWGLTATPMTTDVLQIAKLANVIDSKVYANVENLKRRLLNGKFRIDEDTCFFINRTKRDFGCNLQYKGFPIIVDPLPHQRAKIGGDALMKLCKGDGAYVQVEALVNLLKSKQGERGLVFIHQHSVRAWVLPFLERAGIKYACINGKTNSSDFAQITEEFNNGTGAEVVITSVTESLDLDCDYVVFYEFTAQVKQMLGRAHRGFDDKTLLIYFVITRNCEEVTFFTEKVYQRSIFVRDILSKECAEIEDVREGLLEDAQDSSREG